MSLVFKEKLQIVSQLFEKIKSNHPNFNDKEWQQEGMTSISFSIEQWPLQQLRLKFNYYQPILRQISHIRFPLLTGLYLFKDSIESIEILPRMCIPLLQILDLSCNKINKIKSLRKGDFSSLKKLWYHRNRIDDCWSLAQFKGQKMIEMTIQMNLDNPEQSPDIRWTGKLEASKLQSFEINSNQRIRNRKIQSKLKGKYPSVKIRSQ